MIVLAYNLPGVDRRAQAAAQRLHGHLPRQNPSLGRSENCARPTPDFNLPATNIAVIGRLDSSGTTFAFTSHLAAVNPSWSERADQASARSCLGRMSRCSRAAMRAWRRASRSARARSAMSNMVLPGGSGCRWRRWKTRKASLSRRRQKPERARDERLRCNLGLDSLAASVVDPSGAEAYPIVTYSWLMLHRAYSADQGRALRVVFEFRSRRGQRSVVRFGIYSAACPRSLISAKRSWPAHHPDEVGAAAPSAATKGSDESTAAPEAARGSPAEPAPSAPSAPRERLTRLRRETRSRASRSSCIATLTRWRDIVAANPKLDPRRRLRAGQVLKLPEPVEATGHSL